MRSTPRLSISLAALLVSPEVVFPVSTLPITVGTKPASLASSSPISCGYETISTPAFSGESSLSASTALAGDVATAPSSLAFLRVS